MDKEKTSEKMSWKDKLKAQAMAARMGVALPKEYADVAADGMAKFRVIVELSTEANAYVYEKNDDIKPDPDYARALDTVGKAMGKLRELKPAGEWSATLNKKLYESFIKLQRQRVILEHLQKGESVKEARAEEIQQEAEARAVIEW